MIKNFRASVSTFAFVNSNKVFGVAARCAPWSKDDFVHAAAGNRVGGGQGSLKCEFTRGFTRRIKARHFRSPVYIHLLSLLPFLPLEKSFVCNNWDRQTHVLYLFFFFFLLDNWPWRTTRCHVIKMVDRTGLRLIDRFVRIGRVDCFDFVDKSNEFIASKICGNFLFLFSNWLPFPKIKRECTWRNTRPIERRPIPLARS